MNDNEKLSPKQQYLQYLLPKLNDEQIDKMVAAIKAKQKKQEGQTTHVEENPYAEIMDMIGCNEAKEKLNEMISDFRMNRLAAEYGRKHERAYFHASFHGNPGTNKTSTGRLFAKVLAQEGIIKKAQCVELTRSDIVGQYVGSTAVKVQEIFRKYADCLILIDEAYSLCDGNPNSNNNYGEEAINELIVCLENHPETVVILAGYPDRMDELLQKNPGLSSRIPYRVNFADYTAEELMAISKAIARDRGFCIADSALDKLFSIFDAARQAKDFSNGRFVRNTIEAAIRRKGILLGIMEKQDLTDYMDRTKYSVEDLFSLDEDCFEVLQAPAQEYSRRIGFCS